VLVRPPVFGEQNARALRADQMQHQVGGAGVLDPHPDIEIGDQLVLGT